VIKKEGQESDERSIRQSKRDKSDKVVAPVEKVLIAWTRTWTWTSSREACGTTQVFDLKAERKSKRKAKKQFFKRFGVVVIRCFAETKSRYEETIEGAETPSQRYSGHASFTRPVSIAEHCSRSTAKEDDQTCYRKRVNRTNAAWL